MAVHTTGSSRKVRILLSTEVKEILVHQRRKAPRLKGIRKRGKTGGRAHLRVLTRMERSREEGPTLRFFLWALGDLCP